MAAGDVCPPSRVIGATKPCLVPSRPPAVNVTMPARHNASSPPTMGSTTSSPSAAITSPSPSIEPPGPRHSRHGPGSLALPLGIAVHVPRLTTCIVAAIAHQLDGAGMAAPFASSRIVAAFSQQSLQIPAAIENAIDNHRRVSDVKGDRHSPPVADGAQARTDRVAACAALGQRAIGDGVVEIAQVRESLWRKQDATHAIPPLDGPRGGPATPQVSQETP